ncbi:hypothetical protein F4779DRAFT_643850 [Xylariaceae sp. FL0662B]|nr:hypothetical protein F4779DRAFT_643850 [Xylariaceae sp. FL0662B]
MPSPEQPGLLATPCVTCRDHHLKCDRSVPRCGRCVRAGRECKLAFKFKSSKVIYVDETQYLVSGSPLENVSQYEFHVNQTHSDGLESSSADTTPASIDSGQRKDVSPLSVAEIPFRHSPRNNVMFPDASSRMGLQPRESLSEAEPDSQFNVQPLRGNTPPTHMLGNSPISALHDVSPLPLRNRTEAVLFRHYIQKIAICLDLSDPLRHFELVVPERAGICHTLLNAVFAIAARHLSHTTNFDPLASNRYHDECLRYLIPMLNHTSAVSDENLFAATIILRMLEEMDGSTTGQDNYSHLLGIHAFVNVGDQYMIPGSLSAASFWVGLRQEIYIAVITQQPVKLNLDHFVVDRSFEPTDDFTWSNRAVVHLADVLNFCFGKNPSTVSQWDALQAAAEKWSRTRPVSFNPFFYRERKTDSAFPEIWHGSSNHIVGIQHHILAQLFLAQFDPSIPRVGTNRRAAIKRMTDRIEMLVREICGIAICNQWSPPSMFTASMGIAMFGDQFGERSDQEALVDILKKTEAGHARPTAAIQHQLMKAWGWIPDNDE